MGIGYNQINNFKNSFIKTSSQRPIIGFKANDDISAHSYDGVLSEDVIITAGEFIQAAKNTKNLSGESPLNPNVFTCKKAEANKISGVMLISGIEVQGLGDKSAVIKQGQLFKFAGIGSGCEVYLLVHTDNATSFDNAIFPVNVTADLAKGGVKVAGANDSVIGKAISNIIINCQYLKNDSGSLNWETCLGIKVRL